MASGGAETNVPGDMATEPAPAIAPQEPPGASWPQGRDKPKGKIDTGPSPPGAPIIDPDPEDPGAAHTLCVQIKAADFHNKAVSKMLRDLTALHIVNLTGKLDWMEDAEKGVGTITSVNGEVFVDTIIVQFFIAEYHTKLVRADKAPLQEDDESPL